MSSKAIKPKVRKLYKLLNVPAAKEERDKLTAELLKYLDDLDAIEREKKDAVDGFKTRIDNKEAAIWGCRSFIREGYLKSIICEERFDWEAGTVTLWRLDSNEKISQRKISLEERQETFTFTDVKEEAPNEKPLLEADALFDDAKQLVIDEQKADLALLQEKLEVGFGRGNQLLLLLEAANVIGPLENGKARKVLIKQKAKGSGGIEVGKQGEDPLFDQAADIAKETGEASVVVLQRRMKIGYGRAARLMDLMEEKGLLGPADQFGVRKVVKLADKPAA